MTTTPTDVEALVERLRRGVTWSDGKPIGAVVGEVNDPVMRQAADRLAALTAAQPVEGGWQPIESAPKDGTPLILFARCKKATAPTPVIGWYTDGEWIECCFMPNRPVGIVPLAWMPRPAFPDEITTLKQGSGVSGS